MWHSVRRSQTSTGSPPSYKPLRCLQISCLAVSCFTLQIRPCLHLLHTDNGHYGLPWLTTQVTNQSSQGGQFSGKKRGSNNWEVLKGRRRRKKKRDQHDPQWSDVSVGLSWNSHKLITGLWEEEEEEEEEEEKEGSVFAKRDENNFRFSSGSSGQLLLCHIQTQAINTKER